MNLRVFLFVCLFIICAFDKDTAVSVSMPKRRASKQLPNFPAECGVQLLEGVDHILGLMPTRLFPFQFTASVSSHEVEGWGFIYFYYCC